MRIHVTREDIEDGRVRDAQNCAVAIALRRAGVAHFGVSGMLVWVASGHRAVVLPGPVQEWILNYDYGMQMMPIEFDLHLPEIDEVPQATTAPAPVRPASRRSMRSTPVAAPRRTSEPEQSCEFELVGK